MQPKKIQDSELTTTRNNDYLLPVGSTVLTENLPTNEHVSPHRTASQLKIQVQKITTKTPI